MEELYRLYNDGSTLSTIDVDDVGMFERWRMMDDGVVWLLEFSLVLKWEK